MRLQDVRLSRSAYPDMESTFQIRALGASRVGQSTQLVVEQVLVAFSLIGELVSQTPTFQA